MIVFSLFLPPRHRLRLCQRERNKIINRMTTRDSTPKPRYQPAHRDLPPEAYGAIDVGSEQIFAAINGSKEVKVFTTMTAGVRELATYFVAKGVQSVAIEATGSLWISIYELLEEAGLKLIMVNGGHVKNLPGRKTDFQDCQWLAYLHGQGLLSPGFVPTAQIRCLRDYHRLRQDHVTMGSAHIQHMQKALDRMNLKLHLVFSQTIGVNCLRLIEAIVKGVREPALLLGMCDEDIHRRLSKQLLQALEGNYLPEHVFALEQGLAGWKFYQQQIVECDQRLEQALGQIRKDRPEVAKAEEKPNPNRVRDVTKRDQPRKNAPRIADLKNAIAQVYGQDVTKLPGITTYTATQLLAEIGYDLSAWPTVKQFVAWLGLAPGTKNSGKRRRRHSMPPTKAGQIFKMACFGLTRSKYLALGGFLRRVRGRRGPQVAIKAAARKLAVMFYNVLTKGWDYVEKGLDTYEKEYQEQVLKRLSKAAQTHGFQLVPTQPVVMVP